MNEYMAKADVYNTLTKYYHHHTDGQHKALKDALSKVPVIEVVKCKDCKYAVTNETILEMPLICGLTKMCGQTDPEWYCADGERKE